MCSWVAEQSTSHAGELWIDGARDYVSHAEKLLKVCWQHLPSLASLCTCAHHHNYPLLFGLGCFVQDFKDIIDTEKGASATGQSHCSLA
jgi:hypothetical protein